MVLPKFERTQGDGTEHPDDLTENNKAAKQSTTTDTAKDKVKCDNLARDLVKIQSSSSSILYDPSADVDNRSFNYPPPVLPIGKKFYLTAKLVQPSSTAGFPFKRQPRLVLMEPYKVSFPYQFVYQSLLIASVLGLCNSNGSLQSQRKQSQESQQKQLGSQ